MCPSADSADAPTFPTFRSLSWVQKGLGVSVYTLLRYVACGYIRIELRAGALPGYCVQDVVAAMEQETRVTHPHKPFGKPWLAKQGTAPTEPASRAPTA